MFWKKGSIEINLSKNEFKRGESIEGEILLQLKKNVKAKSLTIRLIAKRKSKQRLGGSSSTKVSRVHDEELNLDGEKEYSADRPLKYPFKIKIPTKFTKDAWKDRNVNMMPKEALEIRNKIINAAKSIGCFNVSVDWYLIANLTVPGIFNDVKKKIQVNIVEK